MTADKEDWDADGTVWCISDSKRLQHWCQEGKHEWYENELTDMLWALIEVQLLPIEEHVAGIADWHTYENDYQYEVSEVILTVQ